MSTATLHLPDDIAALKALVVERDARIEQLEQHDLPQRDARIAQLEHQVARLQRAVFGPRSERSKTEDPGQGFVFPELLAAAQRVADETGAVGVIEVEVAAHTRKRRGRRKEFPEHLPRVRTVFGLKEGDRTCCGQLMTPIGEETRQQLERIEVTLVHEIARTKYACRACQQKVITAPGPPRVIDKGLLGDGFLAHVITERFARHMPYHRLEQKYKDEGLSLSRSVLCRSALRCAEVLEPIYEQMKSEVLASPLIQTDDTPIKVQQTEKGGSRTGRAWVYGDLEDRWIFDFTDSRARDGPLAILGDYEGFVQADAFPGYDILFTDGRRIEVGCWAHARRYFVEAQKTEAELAGQAIARIRQLYRIEKEAKERGYDAAATAALRQALAAPVLDELHAWLLKTRDAVLPKGPMGRAIEYTLKLWGALTRYLEHGFIPIDNNGAERALRPLAVGRKNWLFVGHEEAGKKGAILFSLVVTARAIGLDPRLYLHDVLQRIGTESDVSKLTPHGWKVHFWPQVAAQRGEALGALVSLGA